MQLDGVVGCHRLSAKKSTTGRMDSLSEVTSVNGVPLPPPVVVKPTAQLHFALHYNADEAKLAVCVKSATHLRPTLDGRLGDCFVRLVLVRNFSRAGGGWMRARPRPEAVSIEVRATSLTGNE